MKFTHSLLLSLGIIAAVSSGVGYGVYYLINSKQNKKDQSPWLSLDSLTEKEQKVFSSIIKYRKVMINNYEGSASFGAEVKELKKILKDYATDENKQEALEGIPDLPGAKATKAEKELFIKQVWNTFQEKIIKLSLIYNDKNPSSYTSLTHSASHNYKDEQPKTLNLLDSSWDIYSIFRDFKTKFTGKFADIKTFLSTKENEHILWTFLLSQKTPLHSGTKINSKEEHILKYDQEVSLYMFLDVYSTIFNES